MPNASPGALTLCLAQLDIDIDQSIDEDASDYMTLLRVVTHPRFDPVAHTRPGDLEIKSAETMSRHQAWSEHFVRGRTFEAAEFTCGLIDAGKSLQCQPVDLSPNEARCERTPFRKKE